MSPTHRQAVTRGEVRLYTLFAVVVLFLITSAIAANTLTNGVDRLRATCESGNDARVSELGQRNDLILNAKARSSDPATREEGLAALARARHRKRQLLSSVADPVKPGSARRDCVAAFPKPFPFNYLEGDQ